MSDLIPCSWLPFFSAPGGLWAGDNRRFQVLLRHGDELLYLPRNKKLALRGLKLYQPQSTKARLAIAACRFCTALNLPNGCHDVTVCVDRGTPLAHFFSTLARSERLPDFAVLPGNPHTSSRRFAFLLFDAQGHPQAVVKAALCSGGRELIDRETSFLRKHENQTRYMPRLLGSVSEDTIAALALPFYKGTSPGIDDMAIIGIILSAWLRQDKTLPLRDFPAGRRFFDAVAPSCPENLKQRLCGLHLTPALSHGDFAPWNIRETPDNLTVLDWERGEDLGVPGWDWFHYLVQSSILIRKDKPLSIYRRARELFSLPAFTSYARNSGFLGQELTVFASYLGHAEHLGQSEGLATLSELKQQVYGLF